MSASAGAATPCDEQATDASHRRQNLLTGEWILVSPHRDRRPWQGQEEKPQHLAPVAHDPDCHLCARNHRISGAFNPDYSGTYVFENDFPALMRDTHVPIDADDPLLRSMPVSGTCRVICYSPDHGKTLSELSLAAIGRVVETWGVQTEELARSHAWVQIFENKGEAAGCSSAHPHGQVWATDYLPGEAANEDRTQREWHARTGRPLLLDYARREMALGSREVFKTAHWLAIVPYWASWPFETLLLPRFEVRSLPDLSAVQRADLALALKTLLMTYDRLFDCSFPYSMGWHGAPSNGDSNAHWQLHAHFYPPLLRSATVRKHVVGFELLAEMQRDITPERAAARLRAAFAADDPVDPCSGPEPA